MFNKTEIYTGKNESLDILDMDLLHLWEIWIKLPVFRSRTKLVNLNRIKKLQFRGEKSLINNKSSQLNICGKSGN